MAFWACARTESQRELVAKHFLELRGFEVYVPRVREQRVRQRRKYDVILPLFPTYAFVAIEQQWHDVRWTIGIIALIMDGERPARVPDKIIEDIRRREVKGALELPKAPDLTRGDRVCVTGGPLIGRLGLFAGMKPRERVEVLLSLFNGQQSVTLPKDNIEPA